MVELELVVRSLILVLRLVRLALMAYRDRKALASIMSRLHLHPVTRSLVLVPLFAFTISVLQYCVQRLLNSRQAFFDFGPASASIKGFLLNMLPMLMVAAFRSLFPRLIVADVPLPLTRAFTNSAGNKMEEMLWGSASTWFTVCFLGLRPILNWLLPPSDDVLLGGGDDAADANAEVDEDDEEEDGEQAD